MVRWRSKVSYCPALDSLLFDAPVEGSAGHPHILSDLGCWFAGLNEFGRDADLGVGEGGASAAEVPAGGAAFVHRVVDAFAFDL